MLSYTHADDQTPCERRVTMDPEGLFRCLAHGRVVERTSSSQAQPVLTVREGVGQTGNLSDLDRPITGHSCSSPVATVVLTGRDGVTWRVMVCADNPRAHLVLPQELAVKSLTLSLP